MFQPWKDFRIGRPQILAGLLLGAFLAQCLWASTSRRFSDLEYQYINAGLPHPPGERAYVTSPLTGLVAALPLRVAAQVRHWGPESIQATLSVPHPWLVRLPFVFFGIWLGGAIWWVARRL